MSGEMVQRVNPDGLVPTAGRFAHAVLAPAGRRLAFLAGQAGVDDQGAIVAADVGGQARQTFRNIARIVDELGARSSDIVQLTIYVVDYDPSLLADVDRAGDAVFGADWPVTATTLVGVQGLSFPGLLVEIAAVISVPDEDGEA